MTRRTWTSAIAAIVIAVPATASAQPLWRDLQPGMSKEQVRALYPKATIELGDGCSASASFDYERGGLTAVNLRYSGVDQNKRCAVMVGGTMSAKYGATDIVETMEFPNCPAPIGRFGRFAYQLCHNEGGDLPRRYSTGQWLAGAVSITFKRAADRDDQWWARYEMAQGPSQEAASKL